MVCIENDFTDSFLIIPLHAKMVHEMNDRMSTLPVIPVTELHMVYTECEPFFYPL